MGLFSKDIKSLDDLFLHGLQDLYYAENRILKTLPELIGKATDAGLKQGFQAHLGETQSQVKRLEEIFAQLDEKPSGSKCPAIDGILKEGEDTFKEIEGDDVLNVAMVAAAQAVEHYEITRYGALIAWATELNKAKAIPLLEQSLAEEKATDKKLTAMAERRVNPSATGARSPVWKGNAEAQPAAAPKRAAAPNKRRRA
jgi:ferritin-like metal-binding protein YciE